MTAPIYTGLLGGSFNPAHGGHRRISQFASAALDLDEVWWLVSPGNPLKSRQGMAPLNARVASAQASARRAAIRVTAIERDLGTVFTADTLAALVRRYPKRRFVWLMGSDNLAQFHLWKDWRRIGRTMPIAVIARPGYDAQAVTSPATAWLRRFRVPVSRLRNRGSWSAPALVYLAFDPDSRSATAQRKVEPSWADAYLASAPRDAITRRAIAGAEPGDAA